MCSSYCIINLSESSNQTCSPWKSLGHNSGMRKKKFLLPWGPWNFTSSIPVPPWQLFYVLIIHIHIYIYIFYIYIHIHIYIYIYMLTPVLKKHQYAYKITIFPITSTWWSLSPEKHQELLASINPSAEFGDTWTWCTSKLGSCPWGPKGRPE